MSSKPAPRDHEATPEFDSLWYRDATIYQLHVKSFCDSNGDGIGDFKGLIQKLDYIAELGIDTIWLLPFYPSPPPRRRLRHQRLPRHSPGLRHHGRLPALHRTSACAWHACHHGVGD